MTASLIVFFAFFIFQSVNNPEPVKPIETTQQTFQFQELPSDFITGQIIQVDEENISVSVGMQCFVYTPKQPEITKKLSVGQQISFNLKNKNGQFLIEEVYTPIDG